MRLGALLFASWLLAAQTHPLEALIEAARTDSPRLKELISTGLPGLSGRDGAAVWGQEFLFAVQPATPATVSIDKQPPVAMKNIPGTNYWYKLATLRRELLTTITTSPIAGPWALTMPPVTTRILIPCRTPREERSPNARRSPVRSTQACRLTNYWVYVNAGADTKNGAPVMIWQDGETIVGNADLLRLRLQIVSDNLVHKKLIPPMVHILISPGAGGEAQGTRMRSIQYDTVSDRYSRYLPGEILPEVEKTYRLRRDAYSRAIAGASSGAICALNAAWYRPNEFGRVLSHIGSYTGIQWRPEQNLDGGYIVSQRVRREPKKNIRIWMSDGTDDIENNAGSWPLENIALANALKMRGYDFHFRFGEGMHAIAQGALDLPESLAWLWRGYDPGKTEQMYEMEESERGKPLFRVKVVNRDAW